WPRPPHHHTTNPTGLGLDPTTHPLLGAWIEVAGGDESVSTGRISLRTHPWLADHAVAGTVLLPGAALVELALHAGTRVGHHQVDDLTLEVPFVVPDEGGVVMQVVVGAPNDQGDRQVEIHSRPDPDNAETGWTRHAVGVLGHRPGAVTGPEWGSEWPPAGAEAITVAGAYENLADRGYRYGPAFRGLRAAWRLGDQMFAEVDLDVAERADATRFAVHPALLDAALHSLLLPEVPRADPAPDRLLLPFAWSGFRAYSVGVSTLRVRLRPTASDTFAVAAVDASGNPVFDIDALSLRPVATGHLDTGSGLLAVDWRPVQVPPFVPDPAATWAVLANDGSTEVDEGLRAAGLVVDLHTDLETTGEAAVVVYQVPPTEPTAGFDHATRTRLAGILEVVQTWLASDHPGRLVVLTRGAVGVGCDGGVVDVAGSAVWGFVRSV
ncbi:polyketide synthase dehydratase domain-containing protein, partial [Micromonospora sp. DT31]|uniref:polyketide synthase dehydratase domain-containing protein n=1 Tax=Micromonospora sp. DT31 TaxID=3393434 RepID=UPI003CE8C076